MTRSAQLDREVRSLVAKAPSRDGPSKAMGIGRLRLTATLGAMTSQAVT